jgi:hypothetical protein
MEVNNINNNDYLSSIQKLREKIENQTILNVAAKVIKQNSSQTQKKNDSTELTAEDKTKLQYLQKRDKEVHAHESAHLRAAGSYAASGAKFSYEQGPDRKLYAVSGEVSLDVSKEGTPEKTITKMETIKRAALAPDNPSSQDRKVAAEANATEVEASNELRQNKINEQAANEEARKKRGEDLSKLATTSAYKSNLQKASTGALINTTM